MIHWCAKPTSGKIPLMKAVVLSVCLALPAQAQLQSGHYQTLPGTTVTEHGDRVPGGSRVVPFSATVALELSQPALAAFIPDAVLEGGAPFALTVRTSSGLQQADGSWRFTGDYLRELDPNGSQYLFDWQFSQTNGQVLWNGTTYWAGGHIWYITVTNLPLVPVPWLDMAAAGPAAMQLTWATNFANYILESAVSLPAPSWNSVTNPISNSGTNLSVRLDVTAGNRFYRLRSP